jgi:hypothetical protein
VRVGQSVGQQVGIVSVDVRPVDEVASYWVFGRNEVMLVAVSMLFDSKERHIHVEML